MRYHQLLIRSNGEAKVRLFRVGQTDERVKRDLGPVPQGLLNPGTVDTRGLRVLCWRKGRGCPLYRKMVSGFLALHPLDASSATTAITTHS